MDDDGWNDGPISITNWRDLAPGQTMVTKLEKQVNDAARIGGCVWRRLPSGEFEIKRGLTAVTGSSGLSNIAALIARHLSSGPLTHGVLVNKMRNSKRGDIDKALVELVASGNIRKSERIHKYTNRSIYTYTLG